MKKSRKHRNGWAYVLLVLLSIICVFPFIWMLRSSFMTDREIFSMPIQWLPKSLEFGNYVESMTKEPFGRYFLNSIVISGLTVIGSVFSASFAAYGYTRFQFKGRNVLFAILLSTMMIPYTVLMIPQFFEWSKLGVIDTYIPLILPQFFGNAFNIFLVRQFYMGIPKAYDEAALIDGANYLQIYARVIIPISKPVLCSVGVFSFMYSWNDFMGPLLYINTPIKRTVSQGLQTFIGQYTQQWNLLMAASCVSIVPMIIVFFMAQRYFIEGITFSGIKG